MRAFSNIEPGRFHGAEIEPSLRVALCVPRKPPSRHFVQGGPTTRTQSGRNRTKGARPAGGNADGFARKCA